MQQSKALEGSWFEDSSTGILGRRNNSPEFQDGGTIRQNSSSVLEFWRIVPPSQNSTCLVVLLKCCDAYVERITGRPNGPADCRGNRRFRDADGAAADWETGRESLC